MRYALITRLNALRVIELMLCQPVIVGRDSESAPTDGLIMVGGNSDSRPLQAHQLAID